MTRIDGLRSLVLRCVIRRTVRLVLLVYNAVANQTAAAQKLSLQSILDVNALFVVRRGWDGSRLVLQESGRREIPISKSAGDFRCVLQGNSIQDRLSMHCLLQKTQVTGTISLHASASNLQRYLNRQEEARSRRSV